MDIIELPPRPIIKCGTPLVDALNKAVEAYHQGLPFDEGAFVDEVVLVIHGEWHKVGNYFSEEEGSRVLFSPMSTWKEGKRVFS